MADKFLIALTQIEGLGPVTLKKLLDLFGSAEAVFRASVFDLREKGVPLKIIELLRDRERLNPDTLVQEIKNEGIETIGFNDLAYPLLLKEIYAPPLVLYWRGNPGFFNKKPVLAAVGSRKISAYAKWVMPEILDSVIKSGVVIVSGLAWGVDGLAHELTLKNNGLAIGVLGSGLAWDNFFPLSNLKLAQEILEKGGLLISEFPPLVPAQPFNFPRRNRIIAGLSEAVLVVEASQKSGALITAACALNENREVMAVPQNVNGANAAGVNRLIKEGARVVTQATDILEFFNIVQAPANPQVQTAAPVSLLAEEKSVYQALSLAPLHIDKIAENCRLEAALVNAVLVKLEVKGLAQNIGNQNYIKL